MDKNTRDRLNKIRSNYDALAAGAYAREMSGELDHRRVNRAPKYPKYIWAQSATG